MPSVKGVVKGVGPRRFTFLEFTDLQLLLLKAVLERGRKGSVLADSHLENSLIFNYFLKGVGPRGFTCLESTGSKLLILRAVPRADHTPC